MKYDLNVEVECKFNLQFILLQISVTGKWTLLDENNEAFVCFTFPIKISH